MDAIDQVSNVVIWLIRAGALFRITYCAFRLISAEDDAGKYKNRLKYTAIFYVLAESAFVIKSLVMGYFG